MKTIWRLIRGRHWIKNAFVFSPAFFAAQWSALKEPQLWILFLAFCTSASSIYIVNDLADRSSDRQHPIKKNRPIASGQISLKSTVQILLSLGVFTLLLMYFIPSSRIYLIAYIALNIGYSLSLKKWPLIGVSCIATGFLLRIFAGGVTVDIPISFWMTTIAFLLMISIAWAKRRNDRLMTNDRVEDRLVKQYTTAMHVGFALTFLAYLFYCLDPETSERIGHSNLIFTAPLVGIGILRYVQIIFTSTSTGDPTQILLSDRTLQLILILWISLFGIIIYG